MTRFKQNQTAQKALSQTVKLADVKSEDYDTVSMWADTAPCGISQKAQIPSLYSSPFTIPVSRSLSSAIRPACFVM
jgi:hypothetical protein